VLNDLNWKAEPIGNDSAVPVEEGAVVLLLVWGKLRTVEGEKPEKTAEGTVEGENKRPFTNRKELLPICPPVCKRAEEL
jgi:hypothetical protein